MTMLVKEKDIVVPGEELASGIDYLPSNGTYRENEKIIASQIGLVSLDGKVIKIIPLSGRYIPKRNDMVIGKIVNMSFSGWLVDVGYAYEANLSLKEATSEYVERGADLTRFYDFGDLIVAKVLNVTKSKFIDLTMKGLGLRKLRSGRILEVTPTKVPRIIGKQGSMISMIKEATGCNITVAQNGRVWIQGEPEKELLAANAIIKIDKESHTEGLTEKVKNILEAK